MLQKNRGILAYIIGVAVGDGNLSNPNGRATRLRITCDTRYPMLIEEIKYAINGLLPTNKVSIIKRSPTYYDISCYSNKWEAWLGWKAKFGPKYLQKISIPKWIKNSCELSKQCLKGLIQTDGSIYHDRGYLMANFVTIIEHIANDFRKMVKKVGFTSNISISKQKNGVMRFNIRISKDVAKFLNHIHLQPKK